MVTAVHRSISALSRQQIHTMYQLLKAHFDNVRPDVFDADLHEKDSAILMYDSAKQKLQGFSTLKVFEHTVDGKRYDIIFSGDTIMDPAAWNSTEFLMVLLEYMLSVWKADPAQPLFWLLLSKGARTYRMMPFYFQQFFPCCDRDTPEEMLRLTDALGRQRYPDRYDCRSGLIRATARTCRLTKQMATVPRRQGRDRHVRHFLQLNPGYAAGDELVCLAQVDPANIRPAVLRRLTKRLPHRSEVTPRCPSNTP